MGCLYVLFGMLAIAGLFVFLVINLSFWHLVLFIFVAGLAIAIWIGISDSEKISRLNPEERKEFY